jgi:hypothetical protein
MAETPTPPDRLERIHLANLMEGRANCHLTGRWLQFPEAAMETSNGAGTHALMIVEVMVTYNEGDERKLCELVLSREDLLLILNRMPVVPLNTPFPPKA